MPFLSNCKSYNWEAPTTVLAAAYDRYDHGYRGLDLFKNIDHGYRGLDCLIKNIDNAPQANILRVSCFCNEENYPFFGRRRRNCYDFRAFFTLKITFQNIDHL